MTEMRNDGNEAERLKITPKDYEAYERNNPFMAYNHIEICSAAPECSVVKVQLKPESTNLYGKVHGGLLYAMADCVAGVAARADGEDFVTQSAHINFLRNTGSGTVYAKATQVSRGRTMAVFQIEITDENGKLLSAGTVDMFRK